MGVDHALRGRRRERAHTVVIPLLGASPVNAPLLPVVLVAAAVAFALSAAAGLGGSLILVPAMSLLLGPREGIMLASALLALNNVAKVIAYRGSIPWRASIGVLLMTMLGAGVGASVLVRLPADWIHAVIVAGAGLTLWFERRPIEGARAVAPPVLALAAGATSGFSGTSGPLKGLAIRNLGLDRMQFVGAGSIVSLAGDGAKLAVFWRAALLSESMGVVVAAALPLVPLMVWLGRSINRQLGERLFAPLFWVLMGGYTLRLLAR